MSLYFLLILSIVFCAIGLKFLTFKTGNHENDFIFKIMGFVILIPFFLVLLDILGIIK